MRSHNQIQIFDLISFLAILAIVIFLPFSKAGIEASITVGLISFFISEYHKKEFGFKHIPLALPFLFYILAVELSMLQSVDFDSAAKGLLRVMKYVGFYWLVLGAIREEGKFQWVIRIMVVAAFLSCLNGFYQTVTGWDFRHQFTTLNDYGVLRIRGSFNHPNNFAAYLTGSLLVCLFSSESDKYWKMLKFVTAALTLFVLFETKSRTPLLLLFSVLVFACVALKSRRRYIASLLAILSLVCFIYFLFEPDYFERLRKIVFGDGRIRYWRYSLDIALSKPWLGHGVKSFSDTFGKYNLSSIYGDARFVYAHNFILHMWVEIGLIGVFAFLCLIGQFFKVTIAFLRKCEDTKKGSILGLVLAVSFLLLHSMVDNNLQSLQLTSLFWLYVGLVMAFVYQTFPKLDKPSC